MIRKLLLLAMLVGGVSIINAQTVSSYIFSESAGTYSAITGTTAINAGWDDTTTPNTIPLGFSFNYAGTAYTTCSINSNGYITFGTTLSGTTNSYTPISSGVGYERAISGVGLDLDDFNNNRPIIYTTSGATPNRVFTVQWRDIIRFNQAGTLNFQIKLYETTNVIQVVYGTWTGLSTTIRTAEVGLRGATNADFNNRNLTSNLLWANNTMPGTVNDASCRTRSNAYPASGRTFTWSPPTPTITSFPSTACAASSIIINGTNLNGATAVTIGGTAATITANNNTTVTVTVGSGTTGVVSVTTPYGTATTIAPNSITVNAQPATPPAPISNSPQCSPSDVTISAVGTPPNFETWYWQTTATGTSQANVANSDLIISGVGTYTRYIRSYNGTCWSDASSIDVTVNQSASIQTQPIAPAAVCAGQGTVTLTVGATGVTSYQWRRGTTLLTNAGVYSGTDTATLTITNPATGNAGNYTVILNGPECPLISNVAVVTVDPSPGNPGNPTASSTTACTPSGITITAAGTVPAGVTWYWQTSAAGTSTNPADDASTPRVITAVGTTTVYIRAFNGTCWSPGAGSRTVTINQTPTITIQPVAPAQICSGQGNIVLTVSGNSITSWQWQRNGVNVANNAIVSGATTQTLTLTNPTTANAGSYTVILNNATCPVVSTAVDVVINALPVNPGNPTSDSPQCNPTGVTLTRLAAPPVNEQYYWQTTAGGTSTVNGGATYNVNTSATYYIRAYNTVTGCWSSGSGSRAVVVNNPMTTLATAPVPANNATGVCYIGTGSTTALAWTAAGAANGPVTYDVYFGTTNTPPFIINTTQVTRTVGTLAANTTYYWRIVPRNVCGETLGTVITWSFTTNSLPCYCTPSVSNGQQDETFINRISFLGTLNDVTNNSTFSNNPRGYQDFTGLTNRSQQAQGEGVNVFVRINTGAFVKAWVDWNRDGVFSNGENVYDTGISLNSTTFGFTIPATQAVGLYRIRIRINEPGFFGTGSGYDSCENLNNPGDTEDYLFEVVPSCGALITTVADGETCGLPLGGNVDVPVSVEVSSGSTEVRWYTALTGGALVHTSTVSGTTASWTPSLGLSTTYYVTAFNGTCESLVRTAIVAKVKPVANITYNPTNPESCGEDSIVTLTATGDNEEVILIDERFEDPALTGLGTFSGQVLGNNNAQGVWRRRQSTFIPAQQVWFPAISSGFGPNKFAMATSDLGNGAYDNALRSPIANTTGFLNLTLSFKMYYSDYSTSVAGDNVSIEGSTNGGTTWTNIITYNASIGIGTRFADMVLNIPAAYLNQPNFRFRIRYSSGYADGVAVDDIKLYGQRPLAPSFSWVGIPAVAAYTDFAATIPYVSGTPASTVYVKPTLAQLELGTYDFTATATLSNGCTTSQPITITNKSRVWKGTNSQDWNDAGNWLPFGVPTIDNCVIIPAITKIQNVPEALAKNITIKSTGNLEVLSGLNLRVKEWVRNEGTNNFNIRNNASLIQQDNVANTGPVNMDRIVSVKKTDYLYYSSPVDGYSFSNLSPLTPNSVKLRWLPTTVAGGGFSYGNWFSPGAEIMGLGTGYIVRGPSGWTTPQLLTATFAGVPRNGNITVPITRGNYTGGTTTHQGRIVTNDDDNYNLIGNPYPSAISANSFLGNINNDDILGSIYLWPHAGILSTSNPDPFYQNFVYNYNSDDYITYNYMGALPANFDGFVAAGQSFFVLMTDTSGNPSENVYFNNQMRVSGNNAQFLRTSQGGEVTEEDTNPERNRIYLDLVLPSGKTSSILVGYTPDATYGMDRLYDSPIIDTSTKNLYSKIGDENMIIQGRPMPFDVNDQIPLGILIPQQGIYTIAISSVDGLFSMTTQDIFLEDKVTGIIHNLKNAPYMFSGDVGRNDDRFVLRYNDDTTLSNPEILDNAELKIIKIQSFVKVTSENTPIQSVVIYDVLGRPVIELDNVNTMEVKIPLDNVSQGTLIVKVTLQDGRQKTKKVIN